MSYKVMWGLLQVQVVNFDDQAFFMQSFSRVGLAFAHGSGR